MDRRVKKGKGKIRRMEEMKEERKGNEWEGLRKKE